MVYWKDTRTREWRIFWNFITKLQCGTMVCLSSLCASGEMLVYNNIITLHANNLCW